MRASPTTAPASPIGACRGRRPRGGPAAGRAMQGLPSGRRPVELAPEVDRLFIGLLFVTGLVLALVFGLMIVFAVRYRRGSAADRGHRRREERGAGRWSWTTATFVAVSRPLLWGADLYTRLLRPPPGATEIFVVGKQWMWKVQHPGGQREIDELHVPVGRPVRAGDDLAGRDPQLLRAGVPHQAGRAARPLRRRCGSSRPKAGKFHLFCAEFCGTDHAHMGGTVIVMDAGGLTRAGSTAQAPAETLAAAGRRALPPATAAAAATTRQRPSARRALEGLRQARCRSPDGSHGRRRRALHPRLDPAAEARRSPPATRR